MKASTSSTDRIEKRILLRAPRARVWRALTDPKEFGEWFRVANISGRFEPGSRLRGAVVHPGYEHVVWEVTVDKVEAERHLSWRWHPGSADPAYDYDAEPATHVEFSLEDAEGGTLLTIVETGFDALPPGRRDQALRGNREGWDLQALAIQKYVGAAP